ncbi:hypothetical protein E0H73_40870 [Kribbella pittospori]|uniref:Uncharacterized protein n=1 Tax=Kribbella pittospori TaxID=722689 RepID=A0A4R0K173_9ACTN|nr:hypothetical protein E0H73_40870 [Kribbella pittospori]
MSGCSIRLIWASGCARRVRGDLAGFRCASYDCLASRADALFELTDAMLCADGPMGRWADD